MFYNAFGASKSYFRQTALFFRSVFVHIAILRSQRVHKRRIYGNVHRAF